MTAYCTVALVSLAIGEVVRGAESGLPRANLGLLSLQAALQLHGIGSIIIDGDDSILNDNTIFERLLDIRPLIAGFSVSQVNTDRTIAIVRRFGLKAPETLIVLGGHHASIVAAELLQDVPEIDCIVVGDGEKPLSRLAQMALTPAGARYEDVAGVAFRGAVGVRFNRPVPIQDPDKFPRTAQSQVGQARDIAIMASRGCVGHCAFCVSPCFASVSESARWRPRSPEDIVDEIQEILKPSERVISVHFHDADFVGKGSKAIGRAHRIAELILERGFKAEFRFACRADTAVAAGREFWRTWRRAGLVKAYLGLESGLDAELDMYRKGTTVNENVQACELLKACGLGVQIGFIMFHPYSSHQSILGNLLFLQRVQQGHLYGLVASSLVVYPGTGLFERFKKEGLLTYERVYLPIDVKFSSPDVREVKDLLFESRSRQYPQDRLCLDLEFGISAERDAVEVEGVAVRLNPWVIRQYERYRTERALCLQSWVERIVYSPSAERCSLASLMDEQLTSKHMQFVQILTETVDDTSERRTLCSVEAS